MILLAVEKNDYVYVYNENKEKLLSVKGHLHNYSEKFVAIKHLNAEAIDIYDTNGKQLFRYPYDFFDMSDNCYFCLQKASGKRRDKSPVSAKILF